MAMMFRTIAIMVLLAVVLLSQRDHERWYGVPFRYLYISPTSLPAQQSISISYEPQSSMLKSAVIGPFGEVGRFWLLCPLAFALNAAACVGVVVAIRAAVCLGRRWTRRKWQLCIQCGYSLRGTSSGKCPECGASCSDAMSQIATGGSEM